MARNSYPITCSGAQFRVPAIQIQLLGNEYMKSHDWHHIRSSIRAYLRLLRPELQPADLDDIVQEAAALCCDELEATDNTYLAVRKAVRKAISRDDDGNPVYSLARIESVHCAWEDVPDLTRSTSGAGEYSRRAAAGCDMHPVATDSRDALSWYSPPTSDFSFAVGDNRLSQEQ